eukprot:gb/GFBE01080133.1/.p1 GENE.gb/GFBE01080133.1/~~gb/GFBE01080133.1/.p1  ORF type:complete len:508 (+),score=73.07 gb/GFBE01080133.1/:1-1524(+)
MAAVAENGWTGPTSVLDTAAAEFMPAGAVAPQQPGAMPAARRKVSAKGVVQVQAVHATTASKGGGVLSTSAPPGQFFTPPQVQMPQAPVMPQVPRRFPGHFMPHRLCNHWNAHGWCRKAETCTFAHGLQELHPDVQAQLLQQQPGMPPPTVTKDGRLIVPGASKAAGKSIQATSAAAVATAPVMRAPVPSGEAPMLSFPPPAAHPATLAHAAAARAASAAYAATLASASGVAGVHGAVQYPFGATMPGMPGFEFNVGAQPFMPSTMPATSVAMRAQETDVVEESEDDGEDGGASSSSPGKKRPAPAPLTLDDNSPANAAGGQSLIARPVQSPTVGATVTYRAQPLASPMRISVVSRPLASPTSAAPVLSPTSAVYATASSVAWNAISSPAAGAAVRVPAAMPSPIRVSTQFPMQSPTSVTKMVWPGSPTVVLSPTAAPMPSPKTPVPIDRSTFLQARQMAVKVEQGPPGLAMWAPTPTTKASLLGFRYPAPGYVSVQPRTPAQARAS